MNLQPGVQNVLANSYLFAMVSAYNASIGLRQKEQKFITIYETNNKIQEYGKNFIIFESYLKFFGKN